jgi:hypothetical protein
MSTLFTDDRSATRTLTTGVLAGAAAWLTGLLAVGGLAAATTTRPLDLDPVLPERYYVEGTATLRRLANADTLQFGGDASWFTTAGWRFLRAHNAGPRTAFEVQHAGFMAGDLFAVDLTGPTALAALVPPLVLAATGFLLARYRGAWTGVEGALASAPLVVGYAPLSVASIELFARRTTVEIAADGTVLEAVVAVQPRPVPAAAFAALAYPLAFGVLGGFLAGRFR